MAAWLVFVGGPPGVGKTSVVRELSVHLADSVWLEGDDHWRMNPFTVDDRTKEMTERNIGFVLRSYSEAGFSHILFTWVLHRDEIVKSIRDRIGGKDYQFRHFTLLCDEDTLKRRIASDAVRTTDLALALRRLRQARTVTSEKIDTVGKTPESVADELLSLLAE